MKGGIHMQCTNLEHKSYLGSQSVDMRIKRHNILLSTTLLSEYRVSCILCRLWHNWHLSEVFSGWDSPSAMCYLTNQWIVYNLPIDLIDAQALSKAILTPFWGFPRWDIPSAMFYLTNQWSEVIYIMSFYHVYMCLLAAHVNSILS